MVLNKTFNSLYCLANFMTVEGLARCETASGFQSCFLKTSFSKKADGLPSAKPLQAKKRIKQNIN
jgi:hypothetical protein